MSIIIDGTEYESYQDYINKSINLFERIGGMLSGVDERLDFLNQTALRIEGALVGTPPTEIITSPEYKTYIRENVNIFERVGDALTGADERLDYLNETFLRIEQYLTGGGPGIPPPGVGIGDLIKADVALDIRAFLIMLYRLGRAYEVRLFSYLEVDAAGSGSYTYTIPNEYIYIPHIEEICLGIQRVFTRYDYEGGNLQHTETYATDRTVEWTMTPLSRVVEGSFGYIYSNGGTTDTWVKSRFLGSLMRQSDYTMWRQLVREISRNYLGFTA